MHTMTAIEEQHPEVMRTALIRHEYLVREALETNNGVVVKSTGDGVPAAFFTAPDGVTAGLVIQQAMLAEP